MASIIHPSSYARADGFPLHRNYVDKTPSSRSCGDPPKGIDSTLLLEQFKEDVDLTLTMSNMVHPPDIFMHTGIFYDPWHCNYLEKDATAPVASLGDSKAYSGLPSGFLSLPSETSASESNVAASARSSQTFSSPSGFSPTIEPSALLVGNSTINGNPEVFEKFTVTPSDGDGDFDDDDGNHIDNNDSTTSTTTTTSSSKKRRRCTSTNTETDEASDSNKPKRRSRAPGPEDGVKRERFLEKNRAAAHRCRQKKKKWAVEMDDQCRELKARNTALQIHMAQLSDEAYGLKMLLLQHGDCGFRPIQAYIDKTAESLLQPLKEKQQQQQSDKEEHQRQDRQWQKAQIC